MESTLPLIGLLAWLQVKHFVADYLLQPAWILRGKGNLRHPGGYAHAAIHVAGTVPGLVVFGVDVTTIALVALVEFVIHYLIDHFKAVYSRSHPTDVTTRAFWASHGFDQLLHHLTYTGILIAAL